MIDFLTRLMKRFAPCVYVVTTFDDDYVNTQVAYTREATAWDAYRTVCDLARISSDHPPCFASRAVFTGY